MIIPIFCTANIPEKVDPHTILSREANVSVANQTLDLLLTRDAEHRTRDSFGLCIITDKSGEALDAIDAISGSSQPPARLFKSPFLGMSLQQVNEFFVNHIRPRRALTSGLFIVLDENTVSDECCAVVGAGEIAEDEQGLETLRTDFWAARQVITLAELGQEGLLEYRDNRNVCTYHDIPLEL